MTPDGDHRAGTGTGADIVPSPSLEQAREFIRASKAENTLRGYQSDWRDFCAWCEAHGVCPLPASPETVAAYIAECAGRLKVGSIQRRLNAIAEAHKAVGLDSPTAAGMVENTHEGHPADAGHGARAEGPRADRRHPRHGGRHGRGADRRARSGADPARIRRGVPPVGTGRRWTSRIARSARTA